ncbi:hypothetical protein ACH5RR_037377 [Cinchona calisaya]|uniref:Receptor-like serine/threonine-protein kinase n=1 Tax=Cinchona calisaya TaxID=153742 RepID=A0ABD2Y796_9GENT
MAYASCHYIFFIVSIFPFCVLPQNDVAVAMGSILTANESSIPWLSSSGDFAFGFQHLQENDMFLLSVWYDKIPDKTVAWYADSPSNPVPRGSTVKLEAQTGLVLRDPRGQVLWRPHGINAGEVNHGLMNNSGNFILMASNYTWLWETFRFATDTILPLQKLLYDSVLNSTQSETNFSQGRFYLRFLNDGNLVLRLRSLPNSGTNNDTEYYNSQTSDPLNSSDSAYQVIFNSNGSLYMLKRNNQTIQLGPLSIPPASENYYRATLDFDGVFTYYSHPKTFTGNSSWTILWAVPKDICADMDAAQGTGACGSNNICSLVDRKPICQCLKGYSLLDPNDKYGSCMPNPCLEEPKKPKDRETVLLVQSVFLGGSLFLNLLFIGVGFQVIYQKRRSKFHLKNDVVEKNLCCFSYKELAEATNDFKEELGRGSFGIVYKGYIKMNSRNKIVAVKKLDRVTQDSEKEFLAEVNTIGQTNHKYLVRLLGLCYENQHRLLVYEYMPNGTLASFLFCNPRPSWDVRTSIAIGIARGLVYLHEECTSQIIHCDIKPQNILLDDYFSARISDFGLAKLLLINQSQTLTNIRGTKGYVAPEWFRNSQITAKVDVYSFGVLLLEIISCRRSVMDVEIGDGGKAILTDWVWDCFEQERLDCLVENDLDALEDKMKLVRFVMIGIWCIQEDPSLRPTMRKVSHVLEGIVDVMVPPCPSLVRYTS